MYVNEQNEVIGNCTIIPVEYFLGDRKTLFGLSVDIFIHESYRNNALALFELYTNIKTLIALDNVQLVMGVPNINAYNYWKHFIGWKDIGEISYYGLPIRIGNISNFSRYANFISLLISFSWLYTAGLVNSVLNFKKKKVFIYINRNNVVIEEQRYNAVHHSVILKNKTKFFYRISNEKGTITAYLIDFYNSHKVQTSRSLFQAVSYIISHEKIDLVVYIGQLKLFQWILFKIPKKLVPKNLYLMAENINLQVNDIQLFNIKHWDFGLLNFDVR